MTADTMDHRAMRQFLMDAYGPTRRLPPDVPGEIVAYGVSSEKAAYCYADAENLMYGNLARVEVRESVGWTVIVDLRPQIERARREAEDDQ